MNREIRGLDRLWISIDHALWSIHSAGCAPRQSQTPSKLTESQSWMRINHSGEVCAQALFLGAMCFARTDDNFNTFASLMRQEFKHLSWCKERLFELNCPSSPSDPIWAVACFIMASVAGARGDTMAWSFIEETEVLVIRHLRESYHALKTIDPRSASIIQKIIQDETQHASHAHQSMPKVQRTGFLPYMKPLFNILKQVVQ